MPALTLSAVAAVARAATREEEAARLVMGAALALGMVCAIE